MNKSMLVEMVEYFVCKNAIVIIRIKIIKIIIKNWDNYHQHYEKQWLK